MGKRKTNRTRKVEKRLKKERRISPSRRRYEIQKAKERSFPCVEYQIDQSEYLGQAVRTIIESLATGEDLPSGLRRRLSDWKAQKGSIDDYRNHPVIELAAIVQRELMKKINSSLHHWEDVEIVPNVEGKINVVVRALRKHSSTVFSSPTFPSVKLNGKDYQVRYTDHLLKRLAERSVVGGSSYLGWGVVQAIPYKTQWFEVVRTATQSFLCLWNWCDPMTRLGQIQLEMLDPPFDIVYLARDLAYVLNPSGHLLYYRLGYCPFNLDEVENALVCTTILTPGMGNTPECLAYTRQSSHLDRIRFGQKVKDLASKLEFDEATVKLMKELHALVPQLAFMDHPVFDEDETLVPILRRMRESDRAIKFLASDRADQL